MPRPRGGVICDDVAWFCDSGFNMQEFGGQLCASITAVDHPATESVQCQDDVNNDAWTNDRGTDCDDPDCANDPACSSSSAPALGPTAPGSPSLLLALGGATVLRIRVRS